MKSHFGIQIHTHLFFLVSINPHKHAHCHRALCSSSPICRSGRSAEILTPLITTVKLTALRICFCLYLLFNQLCLEGNVWS